jgi:cytidyltransferase-like protein
MNLGQYIATVLLEAEDTKTIALFPGAFKPPHKGHFEVVQKLLQQADEVVILVSPKTREGITADESVAVWNLYKTLLNGNVEVRVANENPVREVYDVVKNNPDTNFIVAFGKGDMERFKHMNKNPNVKVFDAGNFENVSATGLRAAINNKQDIESYLPDGISHTDFLNLIGNKQEEPEQNNNPVDVVATRLHESPPIEFEQDAYQSYVLQNQDKIEKAAYAFNLPIPDMSYAFNAGREVVLNDDIWSKLENSKSYKMKTLDDAIQHSLKLGINPKLYIDFIKAGKEMPLPLVLCYGQDKYYLVGGEVVLSLYRALGSIPTVLQGTLNLKINEGQEDTVSVGKMKLKDEQIDVIKEFLKYAVKELGLHKLPSGLTLSYDTEKAKTRHTFGTFDPNDSKIWLYVKDRNVADILRTLGHELIHRKQAEEGRIEPTSGNTGSDIENEANAQAGVLLRNFGKNHEEIYENKK